MLTLDRLCWPCLLSQQLTSSDTQVAEDWHLDSTVVFKAISYLDHYLSHVSVEVLCRY